MSPKLIGLLLTVLLAQLGTSIANVALPTLAQAFHAAPLEVQPVVSVYLLVLTLMSAFVGPLGDQWGKGRVMMLGLGLFVLASLAAALAPTLPWLLTARALQGAGAAVLLVFSMAMVGEVVPVPKMGWAMGLMATTNAVGTALGPSLGGMLVGAFGWPSVFAILVPLGLGAAGLLGGRRPADSQRSVPPGSGQDPLTWQEARWWGYTRNSLAMTVLMATLVVGPFYLTEAFALDPVRLGMLMAVGPVVAALAGVPSGLLVDLWGAPRLVPWGLGGMVLGCLLLALVPVSWGPLGYLAGLAVLTASYALFQTANNTVLLTGVATDRRGTVSGMISLSRNLGLLGGTVGLGTVFALSGHPTTAFSQTFLLGAGLLGVALASQWAGPTRIAGRPL